MQANVLGTRFILERSERERDLRRHGISSSIERPALSERDREIAAHGDKEYAQRCKREREMVCTRSLVESFGPPPAKGEAQPSTSNHECGFLWNCSPVYMPACYAVLASGLHCVFHEGSCARVAAN